MRFALLSHWHRVIRPVLGCHADEPDAGTRAAADAATDRPGVGRTWAVWFLALASGAPLLGCTPSIGDHCALSSDCSIQGNRTCDTFQLGGYCTVVGCTANSCPDNAACVELGAGIPGCPYDEYAAPSRFGRSICMKSCGSDSDCRQDEGYVCVNPSDLVQASVLDTVQSKKVCTVKGTSGVSAVDAAVCSRSGPDLGGGQPAEGGADGAGEASADGVDGEGGEDAGDLGADGEGGEDAGDLADGEGGADVTVDSTVEAAQDAGAVDAPGQD
jgi:hypothetical protein